MNEDVLPATAELAARLEALQASVAALEKQLGRAGREQLKSNALAEAQAERLDAALEALRTADRHREEELAAERARARAAVAEARLEVARAMFPVLDGLDEALRAGDAARARPDSVEPPGALLRRLLLGADDEANAPPPPPDPTLGPWLEGLAIVRRRLLDALAAEGVLPIPTVGHPFDPRRHLAVEVVPGATPPGTVVHELRRGFVAGERVLRHAEVAVAG